MRIIRTVRIERITKLPSTPPTLAPTLLPWGEEGVLDEVELGSTKVVLMLAEVMLLPAGVCPIINPPKRTSAAAISLP